MNIEFLSSVAVIAPDLPAGGATSGRTAARSSRQPMVRGVLRRLGLAWPQPPARPLRAADGLGRCGTPHDWLAPVHAAGHLNRHALTAILGADPVSGPGAAAVTGDATDDPLVVELGLGVPLALDHVERLIDARVPFDPRHGGFERAATGLDCVGHPLAV